MFISVLELLERIGRRDPPAGPVVLHGTCVRTPTGVGLAHQPGHEAGAGAPLVPLSGHREALQAAAAGGRDVWLTGCVETRDTPPGCEFVVAGVQSQSHPWRVQTLLRPLPWPEQRAVLEADDAWTPLHAALDRASQGAWSDLVAACSQAPADTWLQHQRDTLERQRWRLFDLDLQTFHEWAATQDLARHGIHPAAGQPGWQIETQGDPQTPVWLVLQRDPDGRPLTHLVCHSPDAARTVALGGALAPLLGRDPSLVRYASDAELAQPARCRDQALSACVLARQHHDLLRAELILTRALAQLDPADLPPASLLPLRSELGAVLLERGHPGPARRVLDQHLAASHWLPGVPPWQVCVVQLHRAAALLALGETDGARAGARAAADALDRLTEPASALAALRSQAQALLSMLSATDPAPVPVPAAPALDAPPDSPASPPGEAELDRLLALSREAAARRDDDAVLEFLQQAQRLWPALPLRMEEYLQASLRECEARARRRRWQDARDACESGLKACQDHPEAAALHSGLQQQLLLQAARCERQRNRPRAALALLRRVLPMLLESSDAGAVRAVLDDSLAVARQLGDAEAECELLEQMAHWACREHGVTSDTARVAWEALLTASRTRGEPGPLRRLATQRAWALRPAGAAAEPQRAAALVALAEGALSLGRPVAALRWARAAGRWAPASPQALVHALQARACAYQALMDQGQALAALEEALDALDRCEQAQPPVAPAARAAWHGRVSDTQASLRRFEDAEQHALQALALVPADDALHQAEGQHRLGVARAGLARWTSAADAFGQARARYSRLEGVDDALAATETLQAQSLIALGRYDEAQRRLRTAVARLQQRHGRETLTTLPASWIWIGLHEQRGDAERIEPLLKPAVRLASRLAATHPRRAAHWQLEHAGLLLRQGQPEPAEAALQRGLDLALLRDPTEAQGLVRLLLTHCVPPHVRDIGLTLTGWALQRLWRRGPQGSQLACAVWRGLDQALEADGHADLADLLLVHLVDDAVLPADERPAVLAALVARAGQCGHALQAEAWLARWQADIDAGRITAPRAQSDLHLARARLALQEGSSHRALEQARLASPNAAPNWSPDADLDSWRAAGLLIQGEAWLQAEALPQALEALREAKHAARHVHGTDSSAVADVQAALARAHRAAGEPRTALALQRQAHETRSAALGPQHPAVTEDLSAVAALALLTGDLDDAEQILQAVLRAQQRDGAPTSRRQVEQARLARVQALRGRFPAARLLHRQVLRALNPTDNPHHHADVLALCAADLHDEGRSRSAARLLERALAHRERALDPTHPRLLPDLRNLLALRTALGADTAGLNRRIEACLARAHGAPGASAAPPSPPVAAPAPSPAPPASRYGPLSVSGWPASAPAPLTSRPLPLAGPSAAQAAPAPAPAPAPRRPLRPEPVARPALPPPLRAAAPPTEPAPTDFGVSTTASVMGGEHGLDLPSAPGPLSSSAASHKRELVKTLMRAQLPLLPRRWRELVVAWRGDDHQGEFRISCLVDVKAADGHLEEHPVAPAPELPGLLEALRACVVAGGSRPVTEVRFWLNRSGTLEPSLRVGRYRPERPWAPNFPHPPQRS